MYYIFTYILFLSFLLEPNNVVKIEGFSIQMPCKSEVIKETISSKEHIFLSECQVDNSNYTLQITHFENNMYHSDSLSSLDFDLDYSQRYFASNGEFNLIGIILKTVKGYPGKEYRFQHKVDDKINFRRVYIVENYLIELIYEAPSSKLYHNEIDQFFNSFEAKNYIENKTPYLKIPSKEEIEERPFIANFGGKTTQKIDANDTDYGKLVLILELREANAKLENGLMALSVIYGDFQQELETSHKNEIIEIHKKTQELTHLNFKWLEQKELTENNTYLKFEYTINETPVIETRKVFFIDNRMYVVNSITVKDQYPNKFATSFINNFKN